MQSFIFLLKFQNYLAFPLGSVLQETDNANYWYNIFLFHFLFDLILDYGKAEQQKVQWERDLKLKSNNR